MVSNFLGSSVSKLLSLALSRLISEVAKRIIFKDRHLVIVVDDVTRALGLEGIDIYVKNLLNLLEESLSTYEVSTALIIAMTSEGLSKDLPSRHTHASLVMMWNLLEKPFSELAYQLSPPNNEIVEHAWYLTNGNPRMLIELASGFNRDLATWLKSNYESKIKGTTTALSKEVIEEITNDLDTLINYPELAKP